MLLSYSGSPTDLSSLEGLGIMGLEATAVVVPLKMVEV
jgi:hypothetical protein